MFTDQVDTMMNQLENILKSFFNVKHLSGVSIEKYRQDEPNVTASWQRKEDKVSMNINLHVESNGRYVQFESNAWVDDEVALKRRWLNKPFGTMRVESLTETELNIAVGISLEEIFITIAKIKEADLVSVADLPLQARDNRR